MLRRQKRSCNGGGDVENQGVADAQLHLTLAISDVSDAFHLIDKFLLRCPHTDLNTIEVFLVDVTRPYCLEYSFAD